MGWLVLPNAMPRYNISFQSLKIRSSSRYLLSTMPRIGPISHSYNIVIFTHDIFFSVYVILEVFLLYGPKCKEKFDLFLTCLVCTRKLETVSDY